MDERVVLLYPERKCDDGRLKVLVGVTCRRGGARESDGEGASREGVLAGGGLVSTASVQRRKHSARGCSRVRKLQNSERDVEGSQALRRVSRPLLPRAIAAVYVGASSGC